MQYSYLLYEDAKVAIARLWTPKGERWPRCAICNRPLRAGFEAHHLLSQRYQMGHNDVRNLVPVCLQSRGRCHAEAHTMTGHGIALSALYLVLGGGDVEKGRTIREEFIKEALPKSERGVS